MMEHIQNVPNQQETVYQAIEETGLPVVIYGAGELALRTTHLLEENGIQPWGYAVDPPYYTHGIFYQDKPVWNFELLAEHPDKFVFVLGLGSFAAVKRFMARKELRKFALLSPYGKKAPMTYEYIKEHRAAFQQTYDWLEDELSRQTMTAFLNLKVSGDLKYNLDIVRPQQYFCECASAFGGGTFVDCGACCGETVEAFAAWAKEKYGKVYAVEADPINAGICKYYLEMRGYQDVETVNCAVWNQQGTISFEDGTGTSSKIQQGSMKTVRTDTIDHILNGGPVNFLKMDVEGAELNAIRGAAESIRKHHPVVAICVYHKQEDLITIPQELQKLADYRFYLRKHTIFDELELVLYGVPKM